MKHNNESPTAVEGRNGSYHCSECGKAAYYDGRCGDGPILLCNCGKVQDGNGTWYDPWDDFAPRR